MRNIFQRLNVSHDHEGDTKLQQLHRKNKEDLDRIQIEIREILGYDIALQSLIEISVRRLCECYTTAEIIQVLEYFELK